MNMFLLFLKGIAIGIANVIPGVSGGTLAVVFNIYDDFVNAITFNVKKIIENRKFVFPVLGGMALGVLIFSKVISFLYDNFPLQTNFFFSGLIIGSIPLLFGFMFKDRNREKIDARKCIIVFLCAAAGLALILYFSSLEGKFDRNVKMSTLPLFTWPLAVKIFLAGFVGAIAMVVPGISGSLLMLIMGVYTIIIASIPKLFTDELLHALILLLPNGIGVLVGLVTGAKLISILLKKVPNYTYAVIFGLILGSVVNVFPGFTYLVQSPLQTVSCIICIFLGSIMAYFSSKETKKA